MLTFIEVKNLDRASPTLGERGRENNVGEAKRRVEDLILVSFMW